MTLQEAIDEMKKIGDWIISPNGVVRHNKYKDNHNCCACPLNVLCIQRGKTFCNIQISKMADFLPLSRDDARYLAESADGYLVTNMRRLSEELKK